MYATVAQIKSRLGTYETLITDELTDTAIAEYITEANGIIDGYIAGAVKLPFANTPPIISSISADIAVRNLWARTQARTLPVHVERDYENAIKLLENIAKGIIKLEAKESHDPDYWEAKYAAARRRFGAEI